MIRAAAGKDLQGIAEVHVASWRETYRGLVPDDYLSGLSVPKRAAAWVERFLRHAGIILVAEHDSMIVGFADFGPSRDKDKDPKITGELYAIYLRPGFLGRGFGRELFQHGLTWIKETGFKECTTLVLDGNIPAQKFYEKMGMANDGFTLPTTIGGKNVVEFRYALKVI